MYTGVGDGTFEPLLRLPSGSGVGFPAAGDVDGDGIVDLIVPDSDRRVGFFFNLIGE